MAVTSCAHGQPQPGPAGGRPRGNRRGAGTFEVRQPTGPGPSGSGCSRSAISSPPASSGSSARPVDVPAMAIVGASFTAGVGPGNPRPAPGPPTWPGTCAGTRSSTGIPGPATCGAGPTGLGPMTRMLGAEQLSGLSPSLVIVQAGYDDGWVPAGLERQQVRRTIELIRAEAPRAAIGLVTVFTSPARPVPARFYRTDSAIVAAARAADPNAIIMDPLTGQLEVPARRRPAAPDRGGRRLDRGQGRRDPARARHRQPPAADRRGRPDRLRRRRRRQLCRTATPGPRP